MFSEVLEKLSLIRNRQCFILGHFQNWPNHIGLWLDDLEELLAFGPIVCSEGTLFPLCLWHSAEWKLQRSSALRAQAQGDSSTVEKLAELIAV